MLWNVMTPLRHVFCPYSSKDDWVLLLPWQECSKHNSNATGWVRWNFFEYQIWCCHHSTTRILVVVFRDQNHTSHIVIESAVDRPLGCSLFGNLILRFTCCYFDPKMIALAPSAARVSKKYMQPKARGRQQKTIALDYLSSPRLFLDDQSQE